MGAQMQWAFCTRDSGLVSRADDSDLKVLHVWLSELTKSVVGAPFDDNCNAQASVFTSLST